MFNLCLKVIFLILTCNLVIAEANPALAPPDVHPNGSAIQYTGAINWDGVKVATEIIRTGKYKTLRINSRGGEILSAMELATVLHAYQLDVVVDKLCNSSCANYIFPAGNHKTIEDGAFVLWHGDARQKNFLIDIKNLEVKALNAVLSPNEQKRLAAGLHSIAVQDLFYKKIGIDGSIARIGQEIEKPIALWAMPLSSMASFGIMNIEAPRNYGTNEYCQSWLKTHYAQPIAQCLNLNSEEIQLWRKKNGTASEN